VLLILKVICFAIWLLIMVIAIKAVYKRKSPAQEYKWQLPEEANHPTYNIERIK